MILRTFWKDKWSLPWFRSVGIKICKHDGYVTARFSFSSIISRAGTETEALEALSQRQQKLGLETEDVIWMQVRRIFVMIIVALGMVLVVETMASIFPKYILNALQRNRIDHLKILNVIPAEAKDGYTERLCETLLFLKYADLKKPNHIPHQEMCRILLNQSVDEGQEG